MLFAKTDPEASGSAGVCACVIDTEQPGFVRGKSEPKLGIRASATCEDELKGCRCPARSLIGTERKAFGLAMTVIDTGPVGVAAQALDIAQAS